MNVLLIGYQEALTSHVSAALKANQFLCERLSMKEAIDPNYLRDKVTWADKTILITTDTFMGLGIDLKHALEATTDVIDELLQVGGHLLHINSTLALGRGDGVKPLSAESDWSDNLDWDEQAYMLHRIDREYWRGRAEGLIGSSLLLPVVAIDDIESNVAKQKADEFLAEKVFPTGSTGFLSQESLTAQVLYFLRSEDFEQPRYLSVDKNLTYQSWLSQKEAEIATTMQPMEKPKAGLWSWINRRLGRSNTANEGYVHVVSSSLSYIDSTSDN